MDQNRNQSRQPQEQGEFEEKVIQIRRVSRKTKGGNRISFTALVIVGDRKGRVGVGLGKGPDVQAAVGKGGRLAKRDMVNVPLRGDTIPHTLKYKYGAARILLKPAPAGSGVIAGGSVRAVVEAAGVRNIVGKILGNNNKMSNVMATLGALREIEMLAKKHAHLNLRPKTKSEKQAKTVSKPATKKTSKTKKK
jgi:small subunit ribosomal protein S5